MVNFLLLLFCLEHGQTAIVTSYSVGGFGNGATFAHQLHVAYSSTIQSAGLVAPSPYYCSMGSRVREDTACRVNPYLIELLTSINYYTQAGTDNLVDPITSLGNDRAYIVSGMNDKSVVPGVVQQTEAFYRNFIHNDYKVITNY